MFVETTGYQHFPEATEPTAELDNSMQYILGVSIVLNVRLDKIELECGKPLWEVQLRQLMFQQTTPTIFFRTIIGGSSDLWMHWWMPLGS